MRGSRQGDNTDRVFFGNFIVLSEQRPPWCRGIRITEMQKMKSMD